MRILVCGGRDYYKYSTVAFALNEQLNEAWYKDSDEEVIIISGEASGADFLAKVFTLDECRDYIGVKYQGFPADWKRHGKAAGAIRNQQMLDEGKPDLVIAFPGGVGTKDMVTKAKKAGVEVIEVG